MLSAANLLNKPPLRKQRVVMVDGVVTTRVEEFIKKAHAKYGGKFDYSLVDYVDTATKVRIVCPDHGMFRQSPGNHLQGSDCIVCVAYRRRDINNAK